MNTAHHLPPLLAELTSDAMLDLPMSARLLWSLLRSRPTSPEPLRLNLKRVKMSAFPFDAHVTVDSLMLDVLMLEERALLATSVGPDGRERYRILTPPAAPSTTPDEPTQLAPSRHIATVERERESESERERDEAPAPTPSTSRQAPRPPARYCADHMPHGPGRERCVLCLQARQAGAVWIELMKAGVTPPDDLSEPPIDTYADQRPDPQPTLFDTPPRSPQPNGRRRRPQFDVPRGPFDEGGSPAYDPDDPDDPYNLITH